MSAFFWWEGFVGNVGGCNVEEVSAEEKYSRGVKLNLKMLEVVMLPILLLTWIRVFMELRN
jgi:hypothetical protein